MRAPRHWSEDGVAARLLAPLGALYAIAGRLRRARATPFRAGLPVICVGNVTAGGAGKTPMVQALAERLRDQGRRPAILLRGHGGREQGPLRVDPIRHDATAVGDEALLHAAIAPTWVARDRAAGARAAAETDADILLLDDGFQNPGLAKDLSLLVVDGGAGFGNGRVIPAGPLREPLEDALARADALVLIDGTPARRRALEGHGLPILDARIEATRPDGLTAGARVVAFAGIGRPEKFFASVEAAGLTPVARLPFADHHHYRPADLTRIAETARAAGAVPITTAKDAARLGHDAPEGLAVLPARLVLAAPAALDALIAPVIAPIIAPHEARS